MNESHSPQELDIVAKIAIFVLLAEEWGDVPIDAPAKVANALGAQIADLAEELSALPAARAQLELIATSHANTAVRIKAATASLRWASESGEIALAEIAEGAHSESGLLSLFAEAVLGRYRQGLLFPR
jgi:hypothetical protein